MLSVGFSLSVGPPPGLTGGMAGCWKVLFEVIVGVEDDIDVMGDEDAVVVVIWVLDKEEAGELDDAIDEATLDAGEAVRTATVFCSRLQLSRFKRFSAAVSSR